MFRMPLGAYMGQNWKKSFVFYFLFTFYLKNERIKNVFLVLKISSFARKGLFRVSEVDALSSCFEESVWHSLFSLDHQIDLICKSSSPAYVSITLIGQHDYMTLTCIEIMQLAFDPGNKLAGVRFFNTFYQ